jgi:hypothetical protein
VIEIRIDDWLAFTVSLAMFIFAWRLTERLAAATWAALRRIDFRRHPRRSCLAPTTYFLAFHVGDLCVFYRRPL